MRKNGVDTHGEELRYPNILGKYGINGDKDFARTAR